MSNPVIVEISHLQYKKIYWNEVLVAGRKALARIFCSSGASCTLTAFAGEYKDDSKNLLDVKNSSSAIRINPEIEIVGKELKIEGKKIPLQEMKITNTNVPNNAPKEAANIEAEILTELVALDTCKIQYALLAMQTSGKIIPYNFISMDDINLPKGSSITFTWKIQF